MGGGRAVILGCFKDVPREIEADWNRWYETSHIPARLALPGFLAARRFEGCGGDYRYVSLYELETPDAVTGEGYLALKRKETALPDSSLEARTLKFPGFVRGVYQQVYPQTPYRLADTLYVLVVAHDVPPARDDAFAAWYETEHIPAILQVPGIVTARRFRLVQHAGASVAPDVRPRHLAIYDVISPDVLDSQQFIAARESPWSQWVRGWSTRRLRIVAKQISRHSATR